MINKFKPRLKTKIVLLGGGYVTVWAYRLLVKGLKKHLARGEVSIIVVCPNEYHAFHGWTAESLTGIIKEENRMSTLSIILSKAEIIKGKVQKINAPDNTISIQRSNGSFEIITYNHLLLGVGSIDNESVEGLREYGYQIKSDEAFHHTRHTIDSLVQEAALAPQATAEKLLRFTIAGGGFAGVELATNIAEYLKILKAQHLSLKDIKPVIQLVNSGDRILNVLQPKFQRMIQYVEKIMHQYNIEIINNNKITKVTKEGAFLRDRFIQSSMVISTIGQSRVLLEGTELMQRDPLNRLLTNDYLQIKNHMNIWAAGDCAHVKHYTGGACPSNALWAIKQGEHVGKNIARSIKHQATKQFTYRGLGQCASLGIGKGVGELYGLQLTGWLAWIMRWGFFNYFMPSRINMLRVIDDWLFLMLRGKRKGVYEKDNKQNAADNLENGVIIKHANLAEKL